MTLEAALKYAQRGWKVIPVPRGKKQANIKNWPNMQLTTEEIKRLFTKKRNIGVLMGEPSGGLVDIDVDDPIAVKLAPYFLPATKAIFGRASKPHSHWLYYSQGAKTKKWQFQGKTIVELRSTGCQTVFPPSRHPEGEIIRWDEEGEPVRVSTPELERACSKLAAATLLAKHWPPKGTRHEAALALAGGLVRLGWSVEEAEIFIEAVARGAGDEEPRDRIKTAIYTAQKTGASPTTGWKRLSEIITAEVIQKILEWLGEERKTEEVAPQAQIISLGEIAETEATWIIYPILPRGEITLLEGDSGAGKSWVWGAIVAGVTGTHKLPWQQYERVERVIILTTEDDPARTIRPRLRVLGADLNRIGILKLGENWGATAGDFEAIRPLLEEHRPDLIVIDPITLFLTHSDAFDPNKATAVRRALTPLLGLARDLNCAVLAVRHWAKQHREAIHRGVHSIDFVGISRSVIAVGRDNEGRRVVSHVKCNLAQESKSFAFEISDSDGLRWLGPVDISADELSDTNIAQAIHERREAEAFLRELLSQGPVKAKEVQKAAREAGLTEWAIRRAAQNLGIRRRKDGMTGGWIWYLPDVEDESLYRDFPSHLRGFESPQTLDTIEGVSKMRGALIFEGVSEDERLTSSAEALIRPKMRGVTPSKMRVNESLYMLSSSPSSSAEPPSKMRAEDSQSPKEVEVEL